MLEMLLNGSEWSGAEGFAFGESAQVDFGVLGPFFTLNMGGNVAPT